MNTSDNNILRIQGAATFDDTMSCVRYQPYQPFASTQYGYADKIHFQIQSQDQYTFLPGSYLIIEGKVNKAPVADAAKRIEATSKARFIARNAVSFLFEECQYLINNVEVDKTRHLGISSLLKGLCTMMKEEARTVYHDAGWANTYVENIFTDETAASVSFNACVPLKLWLGFAEDYNRIIGGARQDLILTRAHNDKNVLVCANAGEDENSTVKLEKITLMMPIIEVNDRKRIELLRLLEGERILEMAFRSWEMYENPSIVAEGRSFNWSIATSTQLEKPRYIIVAFQTARKDLYTAENDKLDHITVRDIRLYLNSTFYPYYNPNIDFKRKQATFLYQLYAAFQKSYYNRYYANPILDVHEFIQSYPLFVFDMNRQNDRINSNAPVDIRLEVQTHEDIKPRTAAYCLIIHDRVVRYQPGTNLVSKV